MFYTDKDIAQAQADARAPYAAKILELEAQLAAERMTDHQKNQLLDALMHYLPMDVRRKVMHEVPQAYNAWCGREVVSTTVNPVS